MKRYLIFLLALCCTAAAQTSRPQPLWTVNVHEEHGLQDFERPSHRLWLRQQGIRFISPDWLAVYQVNKKRSPIPLAHRDVNGGAGNFFLDLKILDAKSGRLIQSMHMPTSGVFSQVAAGHRGNFIVRTGDMLYLISPEWKVLASKPLPLVREAPFEDWHMDEPPSSAHIALVHQQTFIHPVVLADGTIASPGKAKVDVEIVDPDTLQTTKKFSISNYMSQWTPGDRFLVGTHSSRPYHAEDFGVVDFEGRWKEVKARVKSGENCPLIMEALDHNRIAAYSCYGLAVLSESGDHIFSAKIPSKELPASVINSGDYLAVELVPRLNPGDVPPGQREIRLKPLRIDLFDLQRSISLFSIPLEKTAVYCDISREGLVAVLEGQSLSVYAIETKPTAEDAKGR